jgi:hypothetical protein
MDARVSDRFAVQLRQRLRQLRHGTVSSKSSGLNYCSYANQYQVGETSMKIGFISPYVPGHLNPMTALARQLQSRNHEVVFITSRLVEPFIRSIGLPRDTHRSAFMAGHTRRRPLP